MAASSPKMAEELEAPPVETDAGPVYVEQMWSAPADCDDCDRWGQIRKFLYFNHTFGTTDIPGRN